MNSEECYICGSYGLEGWSIFGAMFICDHCVKEFCREEQEKEIDANFTDRRTLPKE